MAIPHSQMPHYQALEQRHVYDVYDRIASYFTEIQHKAWPNVRKFIKTLEPGSLVADIGCGNGRYLHINSEVYKLGCDRCEGMVDIAADRGYEVLVADNLHIPYRDNLYDAVISIAVIHHFATVERRIHALKELARIVRPGGKVLIYVWALEQKHRKFDAQDILIPWFHRVQRTSYKQKAKDTRSHTSTERDISSIGSVSEDDAFSEAAVSSSQESRTFSSPQTLPEEGIFSQDDHCDACEDITEEENESSANGKKSIEEQEDGNVQEYCALTPRTLENFTKQQEIQFSYPLHFSASRYSTPTTESPSTMFSSSEFKDDNYKVAEFPHFTRDRSGSKVSSSSEISPSPDYLIQNIVRHHHRSRHRASLSSVQTDCSTDSFSQEVTIPLRHRRYTRFSSHKKKLRRLSSRSSQKKTTSPVHGHSYQNMPFHSRKGRLFTSFRQAAGQGTVKRKNKPLPPSPSSPHEPYEQCFETDYQVVQCIRRKLALLRSVHNLTYGRIFKRDRCHSDSNKHIKDISCSLIDSNVASAAEHSNKSSFRRTFSRSSTGSKRRSQKKEDQHSTLERTKSEESKAEKNEPSPPQNSDSSENAYYEAEDYETIEGSPHKDNPLLQRLSNSEKSREVDENDGNLTFLKRLFSRRKRLLNNNKNTEDYGARKQSNEFSNQTFQDGSDEEDDDDDLYGYTLVDPSPIPIEKQELLVKSHTPHIPVVEFIKPLGKPTAQRPTQLSLNVSGRTTPQTPARISVIDTQPLTLTQADVDHKAGQKCVCSPCVCSTCCTFPDISRNLKRPGRVNHRQKSKIDDNSSTSPSTFGTSLRNSLLSLFKRRITDRSDIELSSSSACSKPYRADVRQMSMTDYYHYFLEEVKSDAELVEVIPLVHADKKRLTASQYRLRFSKREFPQSSCPETEDSTSRTSSLQNSGGVDELAIVSTPQTPKGLIFSSKKASNKTIYAEQHEQYPTSCSAGDVAGNTKHNVDSDNCSLERKSNASSDKQPFYAVLEKTGDAVETTLDINKRLDQLFVSVEQSNYKIHSQREAMPLRPTKPPSQSSRSAEQLAAIHTPEEFRGAAGRLIYRPQAIHVSRTPESLNATNVNDMFLDKHFISSSGFRETRVQSLVSCKGSESDPIDLDMSNLSVSSSQQRYDNHSDKTSLLSSTGNVSAPADMHKPRKSSKKSVKCQRYYHVFCEGELNKLIENHVDSLHIIDSFYDHANWCVIAEKVQVWKI